LYILLFSFYIFFGAAQQPGGNKESLLFGGIIGLGQRVRELPFIRAIRKGYDCLNAFFLDSFPVTTVSSLYTYQWEGLAVC
jgi:hypothetical protein